MELVIKIDDETYKEIKKSNTIKEHLNKVDWSIRNGTPLPAEHGRLIDASALLACLEKDTREAFTKHQVWLMFSVYNEDVPTIVEADTGC